MLKIENKGNYVIVQLNNGKVNAINTDLAKALKDKFIELENDKSVKGAILSGRPNAFSAGLDVMHLATINQEELAQFWREYFGAMQAMIRFSKPFVCAITGYAPAGATTFTICADYRVMAKGAKHVIGLHEFKMSMQVPELMCDVYAYQMGEPNAWRAIQKAQLYNSDEALKIGLVDESVEVEEVLPSAEKHLAKLMKVFPTVYSQSKQYFRKDLLKIVDRDLEVLVQEFVEFNNQPELQAMIKGFAESLKK